MARPTNGDFDGKKHNVIAEGTKIVGNIVSSGDIRIDGEIQGEIETKGRLVLGETGVVTGSVHCVNAEIMGKFDGILLAEEYLSIRESATVTGDIKALKLAIDLNANFNGTCDMSSTSNNQPQVEDKKNENKIKDGNKR
jgi:cytoskeletal protein CcmA (bactofilin family)